MKIDNKYDNKINFMMCFFSKNIKIYILYERYNKNYFFLQNFYFSKNLNGRLNCTFEIIYNIEKLNENKSVFIPKT